MLGHNAVKIIFLVMSLCPIASFGHLSASIARGKKDFIAYCAGCHALQYGLDGQDDPLIVAMPLLDAKKWFGKKPPDLSLVGITRGSVWLKAYLQGYYPDAKARFGENNTILPHLAMPNPFSALDPELKQKKIDELVHFLVFIADPSVKERHRLGPWVLFFLVILLLLVYSLKISYWKDLDE